jgi:hypothetical protein
MIISKFELEELDKLYFNDNDFSDSKSSYIPIKIEMEMIET